MPSYNRTDRIKPQEDKPVMVLLSNGEEQMMVYYRNLWWDKDKIMYVYFTPTLWRYATFDEIYAVNS